ncbi:polysaccharide pyruvyl transferase family protein [Roseicyclus sp.]|uniref:polysaccharide pyruvyl transferase family protein n=1 Tax=Roseicyclus sp. TaxID=1914329 RepID=UPI001BCC80A2|nr:polysaccharide pyruvyl transferase family protein [Roseicyclus sp.]
MRALFHPANPGYPSSHANLHLKTGLPLQSARTLRQLKSQIAASSNNVGNVVHNEAVAKTFEFDPALSVMGGIESFFRSECHSRRQEFQQRLSSNFDAVFFSFANLIAPPIVGKEESQRQHFSRLSEIVRAINVPLYVFGIGMQERLEVKEDILPELAEFLNEINNKAEIFGCRGAETQSYLWSIGCDRATALGCPSLYVYPSQVQSIKPISEINNKKGVTAGYLDRRHLLGYQPERMSSLIRIASNLELSYVFQNDLLTLLELEDTPDLYSDADNKCDPRIISSYLDSFGYSVPVRDYRFFRDARSWRQFASANDYFFGDRFHGGVVSLQTGRPAFFIYNDVRVKELTEHFSIPSVSLQNVIAGDVKEILGQAFSKDSIDKFQDIYNERLKEYFDITKRAGLVPLKGLYEKRKYLDDHSQHFSETISNMDDSAAGRKISAAVNLSNLGDWNLASVERLICALAEAEVQNKILDLVLVVLEKEDSANLDEALFFRLSQVLLKSNSDPSCEALLRFYLNQNESIWTERILKAFIEVLMRDGNVIAARDYLLMEKAKSCLSLDAAKHLAKRVNS